MPYADPEERYSHVRADRKAMVGLKEAHPDEYQELYDRERAVIREYMRATEAARGADPTDDGDPDHNDPTLLARSRPTDPSAPKPRRARRPRPTASDAPASGKPPGATSRPPRTAPPEQPAAAPPPPPQSFVREPEPPPADEPVVEYQPDPAVPEDPDAPRCPACGLGISRWMGCGCSPGELTDDGVPLDPRFAHLGAVE